MEYICQLLRSDRQRKRAYYRSASTEIAERNLSLFMNISAITCGAVLLFVAISPCIIDGWAVTIRHLIIFPVALVFCALSLLLKRRKTLNNRLVTALCLLFELVLLVLVAWVDLPPGLNAPATFTPFLYVALPCLFIIPLPYQFGLLLLFEGGYVALISQLKSGIIAQQDILNSVVGLVFSSIMSQLILQLHIQEYTIRTKYREMSRHDGLSGILNKQTCVSAMEAYLRDRPQATCAMLVLDIDDFKTVNDSVGHFTGDVLLRTIGTVLTESFRSTDIVGRFGGDEFLVLVRDMANRSLLEEKCAALLQRLRQVTMEECSVPVTCSIGGVVAEGQPADFDSMFQQADIAMYQAKNNGKARFILRSYLPAPESAPVRQPPKTAGADSPDRTGLDSPVFSALAATTDSQCFYIFNFRTGSSRWSPGAVRYFGLPGEYIGSMEQVWMTHIHPDDQQLFHQDMSAISHGKKQHHDLSYRVLNAQGRYVMCTCRGVVHKSLDGAADRLLTGTLEIHSEPEA